MTIARVWRGVVPAARSKSYARYLEATGVPDCLATKGNRGVYVLTRPAGADVEFLFISFWDSVASIRRFAGKEPERARYYPGDREFLRFMEPYVRHFAVRAYRAHASPAAKRALKGMPAKRRAAPAKKRKKKR